MFQYIVQYFNLAMVLKSFFPDVVIPEEPLGQYLVSCLEKFGDMLAMVEIHSEKKVTFQELHSQSLKIAKVLWKAGLRKGDIVGLVMPFDMQYVPLFIAIIYCGAVLFGTKLLFKAAIHNQLAAVKPALVITTGSRFEEIFNNLKSNVPSVQLCLNFDQLCDLKPGCFRNCDDDMPCYGSIDVHNDPAIIYQSSGTTGEPKGIVTTHYGMMALIQVSRGSIRLFPGDTMGTVNPIIHVQSLGLIFYCISQGIKLAYANSLSAEDHLKAVSMYKVNMLGIGNVKTLKDVVVLKETYPDYDLSSLQSIIVGGTTFPPELIQIARKKLDTVVTMGYGMTESGHVCAGFTNRIPPNSVGFLNCNVELKVVDKDTGTELGYGEKGEICIRGPQIMKEYFLKDGTVLDILKDGWLHSGDLGYYDKQGFIYIAGRKKEAIKIQPGNVTVMPVELENVLIRHKDISDVAVAGVPHPDHGEAPRAFVVRKNTSLTETDVVQFFQSEMEQITSLQGGVEFVDKIPRTELGKPLRRELVDKSSIKLS